MAFLPLLGVGLMAGGSILGGISQARAASYQAQVARNNQTIARQNQAYSAAATATASEEAGLKARAQLSGLKAGIAANNIDTTTGSSANVLTSQRELGSLDVATQTAKGAEQVYGYGTQAVNYGAQANLEQAQVGPDIFGGILKGAGELAGSPSFDQAVGAGSLLSGPPGIPSTYSWMTNSVPEGQSLAGYQGAPFESGPNGNAVNPLDL